MRRTSNVHSSDNNWPHDPLANPAFKAPGFLEGLCQEIFGLQRPLECVQVEVTSACAAACAYCPHTTQVKRWRARHMAADTFARLWPVLRQSRRAHLQGWGEPLLHPRFFDFQALAKKAGCATSITTCGLVMDEQIAARVAASGMDIVAFSLAGTDEGSNASRAKAPFASVCQGIKNLRKAINVQDKPEKPEIHFAYLLLADRVGAVRGLPALMAELDVEMAVISTLDYLALPAHKELAFGPTEAEKIASARAVLVEVAEEAEKLGRIIHFSLPQANAAACGCRENIGKTLYVDADGSVSPCVYLNVPGSDPVEKRRIYGNVNELGPLAIWKKADYRQFRARLLAGDPDAACLACPKRWEG